MIIKICILLASSLIIMGGSALAGEETVCDSAIAKTEEPSKDLLKWIELFECRLNKEDSWDDLIVLISHAPSPFLCSLASHFADSDSLTLKEQVKKKELAYKLYLIAANRNDGPAIVKLCQLYFELGVLDQEAIYWEKKGSELGLPECMILYAIRLQVGKQWDGITEEDPVEGCKWMLIAAEMGEPRAQESIDSTSSYMSKEILEQAKKRANEWKTTHPELFK